MKFEEYIEKNFPDDWETDWAGSELLEEGMSYSLTSGGKRVRPLLCLKLCDALGGDIDQAKVFGRATEVFHNYTLVHDDILDDDTHRRDQESVWRKCGRDQAIVVGDGLSALSYRYLAQNRDMFEDGKLLDLFQILNKVDLEVNDGQSIDVSFRERKEISEEEYMEMTRKKTSSLLKAALEGAAVIADADEATKRNIEKFGEKIGPAFQIRDDVIDLVGNKGRESHGQDIGEGKRSLVVVKALNRLDEGERQELLTILDKSKENTSSQEVDRSIELFKSVDAIEDANKVAEDLANEAIEQLDQVKYDVSDVREIAEFLVERKF